MKPASAPKVANKAKPPAESPKPALEHVPRALTVLRAIAFFLTFYLCLSKWIDVRVIYHGGGKLQDFPSFYWGWEFARAFRTHPGGFAEYVSALLAQPLYSSAFGALAVTLQAALIYLCTVGSLRALNARRLGWLAFVPSLFLLAIFSKYRHFSTQWFGFSLGVVLVWAWLRFSLLKPPWSLAGALLPAICLYPLAPSALFVFVPLVLLSECRLHRFRLAVLAWLGTGSLIPWFVGAALFGFAPSEAYAKLLPFPWDPLVLKNTGATIVIALYLLPSGVCMLFLIWHFARTWKLPKPEIALETRPRAQSEANESRPSDTGTKSPTAQPTAVRRAWELIGLAAAPPLLVLAMLNSQTKTFLEVDYLAWHGRWQQVLDVAGKKPRNPFVACAVAQASYHTGNLRHELPPLASPLDLLLFRDKEQSHWKKSDLYFDLGYLNMALHHLTESMEFYGERPPLLQRLALVNLALTNISTAKVYLGTLARAPFQGHWAQYYLARLKTDPTLASDPEVSRLRRLMVRRDSVLALSVDEELLMLLGANRQNRMAFEYLMTYYLLTKDLRAFVKNIARLKDFPGLEISPLWDEALLLAGLESGRAIEVPGHVISPEAQARVTAVTRVIQQHSDNAALARRELTADYAHTYSYYWCFDR